MAIVGFAHVPKTSRATANGRRTSGEKAFGGLMPHDDARATFVYGLSQVLGERIELPTTCSALSGHSTPSSRRPRWPRSWRERRAPALWRGGEVQLDRFAAGARARVDGELSVTGLE